MSAVRQAAVVLISTLIVIVLMLGSSTLFFGIPLPSPLSASGASIVHENREDKESREQGEAETEAAGDADSKEREIIKPVPIEPTKAERMERLQERLAYAAAAAACIAEEKRAAEETARAEEAAAMEAERQAELEEETASESSSSSTPATVVPMSAMSISFLGTTNSYIDTPFWSSAPKSGAGLWAGSDSTTDGSWGYFIGHHPGDFYAVMNLGAGDIVKVCDRNGNSRSYSVVDAFTVPDTTWWEDLQERVCGYGESVILQTCVGNGCQYRIVVAA